MRPVHAGEFRHTAALTNLATKTGDGDGGFTEGGAALSPATVSARVLPATASNLERIMGGVVVVGQASHIVTVRYHSGITLQTKLTINSRVFHVVGKQNEEERNILLHLACIERVT